MIKKMLSFFGKNKRSFVGAVLNEFNKNSRLYDIIRTNEDIRQSALQLVTASRNLAKNSGDYRKYIKMCEKNIVGASGIKLQMKTAKKSGKPNERINAKIEKIWDDFSAFGNCTTNRQQNFRSFLKSVVRAWKVDGEVFVWRIKGFNNKYEYAYQLLDPLACPYDYNTITPEGHRVIMGIELDRFDAPIAYYFRGATEDTDVEGNFFQPVLTKNFAEANLVRIPANEINHFFSREFVGQLRGFPSGQAAIQEINLLDGYYYAELVAADAASRKFGKLVNKSLPANYGGRSQSTNSAQTVKISTEPNSVDVLTGDWDFLMYDPKHPNQSFAAFVKSQRRKIANALDVAYPNFANDLEAVNFSSMRGGVQDERDSWMDAQATLIEEFLTPEFTQWLEYQALKGRLPISAFDILDGVPDFSWIPRRWAWVDPVKDAQATILQLSIGAISPQEAAANLGGDFAENVERLKLALPELKSAFEFVATSQKVKTMIDKPANSEGNINEEDLENGK